MRAGQEVAGGMEGMGGAGREGAGAGAVVGMAEGSGARRAALMVGAVVVLAFAGLGVKWFVAARLAGSVDTHAVTSAEERELVARREELMRQQGVKRMAAGMGPEAVVRGDGLRQGTVEHMEVAR